MADIYKSVHENQLRNRLQILHVIDVDSANISKAFAQDIKKAKDSAKEEKIRKVMKEFKEGTLKSSSGELVTDRKQAIAIAISEAENIEKSDDADSDNSEESIEKSKKANIGDIHIWGGKRYKKISNEKWVEVSEHGMSKKEHEGFISDVIRENLGKKLKKEDNRLIENQLEAHKIFSSKLSDKEYDESEFKDSKEKKGKKENWVDVMDNMTDEEYEKLQSSDKYKKSYSEYLEGIKNITPHDRNLAHTAALKAAYYDKDIQKSVFDEIQENIEKSLNSISEKVSEELLNDIEKSISHKYFKREGTPGHYRYFYTEEEYKNKVGHSVEKGKVGESYNEAALENLVKHRDPDERHFFEMNDEEVRYLHGFASANLVNSSLSPVLRKKVLEWFRMSLTELGIRKKNKAKEEDSISKYRQSLIDSGDKELADYAKKATTDQIKRRMLSDKNKDNFVNDKQEEAISKLKEKYNEDYTVEQSKDNIIVKFDSGETHILDKNGKDFIF